MGLYGFQLRLKPCEANHQVWRFLAAPLLLVSSEASAMRVGFWLLEVHSKFSCAFVWWCEADKSKLRTVRVPGLDRLCEERVGRLRRHLVRVLVGV